MPAYKLDVGLDKFGPEEKVDEKDVDTGYCYRVDDESSKPVYYRRVKKCGGYEEVVVLTEGYEYTGDDRKKPKKIRQVSNRYREYRNKYGELVRDWMNSWIRPKRVVKRIVFTKGGAEKNWSYDSKGYILDFSVALPYEDNKEQWNCSRSVRFNRSNGNIEYIQTKKGHGWYTYLPVGWTISNGAKLLSEGSLPQLEALTRKGVPDRWDMEREGVPAEEIQRRQLEAQQALPKYKIREFQRGDVHGEGWMQGEWKVGEWSEKPPRCRKRRPVFYIRGVAVPEKVYKNPQLLTPDEILNEENAEVRRIMLEELGYDVFLNRCGDKLKLIDQDNDPHIGTLYHLRDPHQPEFMVDWRGNVVTNQAGRRRRNPDANIALLKVKDGTLPKHYVLRVPTDMKTARAANAWTWGMDPKEYNPAIER